MANDPAIRRQAIAIIRDYSSRNRSELLKAVFDLRHNAELGGGQRPVISGESQITGKTLAIPCLEEPLFPMTR